MAQPGPTPPTDQPIPPAPQYATPAPQYGAPAYGAQSSYGAPGYPVSGPYPGQPGFSAASGPIDQAWVQPSARAARGPAPFALISAGLGLLGLVLSFFPWVSLRVQLGELDSLLSAQDRSLLNSTLDDLYANAWDLRWATRAVLLAVLAALLVAMPVVDRRLRGPWTLAAAVLASGCAAALMVVQMVNRTGIYGRAVDVISDLANNDVTGATTQGVRASLALRWGAYATAAMVFAQFAVLLVLWLQSRPSGETEPVLDASGGAAAAG